jgi:D-alanyl-D-alanine endopeptidase (penicillin-binding protein 7)
VIRTRLFRTLRLVALLAAVATVAVPAPTEAAVKKSTSSTANRRLTLKKRPAPAAKKTTRSRRATTKAKAVQRQVAEAAQPRFKLDETGALVPDIRAEAAIIYNPANGKVLWQSNAQDQRSIASITKVMTAVVFLENPVSDMFAPQVVQTSDVRNASTTYLRAGYTVTADDLLHLMLIASDNGAARALARISPLGYDAFIARMTEKAKELGLTSTRYADPSGLDAGNVSSAYDLARLITYVSGDERISSIMRTPYYTVNAGRHTIQIHSTNRLVMQGDIDVQAAKTGFISKAGYCLATLLRLPQGGPQVAVVVLGAKSNNGRFGETRNLFNWLSAKAGELFGTGEAAPTPAAAAASSVAN